MNNTEPRLNVDLQKAQLHLDGIIENGYDFSISEVFRNSFQMFSKKPFELIVAAIIYGIMSSAAPFGYWFLGAQFSGGFYNYCRQVHKGKNVDLEAMFKGFNIYVEILVPAILVSLIVGVGFFCLIIPGIFLAVSLSLYLPLVTFFPFEYKDAIKYSYKIVVKNWFKVFGFFLLVLLLNIGGLLVCGIGLLVTIPISMSATYFLFNEIVLKSLDEENKQTDPNVSDSDFEVVE